MLNTMTRLTRWVLVFTVVFLSRRAFAEEDGIDIFLKHFCYFSGSGFRVLRIRIHDHDIVSCCKADNI